MSYQRDYEGIEYERYLFDINDTLIDEHYIDGDALQSNLVDRSVHNRGGECVKCGYNIFSVNSGKEYCALCNEFYDTYKYLRESSEVANRKEKMSRQIIKEIEKAKREGDFVKAKEMEQALVWSQMDTYDQIYSSLTQEQEKKNRQLKKSQDAYISKKINHMNSNRANYYDINP